MPLLGKVLKQFVEARNELKIRPYQAARNQNNTLRKLLRKAEFTEFGREHGFTAILQSKKPEQLFNRNVPLSDYVSIYKNWWHRSVQGERDVCWPGQVKYFALSSGTSDSSSKRIPITKDMIHAIRNSSLKQILAMSNFNFDETSYEKGIMMLGGSTNLKRKGSYYEGDLSGISARNIPTWFQAFYKPGKKIAQLSDWERKLDEIAAHAHQWDIAHICGIPAWNQLMLERIIAHHRVKHIHEVWPNLTSFVHGGVAFEPYRKSFEKLLGKPITYIDTYLASEGFIAYQNRPDTHAMRLLTRNGIYFEFIPFDDAHFDEEGNIRNGVTALTLQEVNTHTDYALVLSTCAGAWRYLIGDTIRFVNTDEYELVITGRTKHFLSLCGEHLSVENMNHAIAHVNDTLNIGIREYTVCGVPHQTLFAHHWFVGCDEEAHASQLKELIDSKLNAINDDYATERISALKDIMVTVLPVSIFYDWQAKHQKLGGQNKFPRVMKGERLQDWLSFLKEKQLLD